MQSKKRVYVILAAVLLLALAAEVLWAHPHYSMIWNMMPGADIVIGFAGAWILILLAKKIIASLFQRRESYYDDSDREGGNGHD